MEAERALEERARHAAGMWTQEGFGPLLGASITDGDYKHAHAALYNPEPDRYGLSLFNIVTREMIYHADVNSQGGVITEGDRTAALMTGNDFSSALGLMGSMKFARWRTSLAAELVSDHQVVCNWSLLPEDSFLTGARKAIQEGAMNALDSFALNMRSMWRFPPDLRR